MARGYDPIQRSEQWKRRVDREEVTICSSLLKDVRKPKLSSADVRLNNLEQALLGGGQGPASILSARSARGGGSDAGSFVGSVDGSVAGSATGSASARMAGTMMAQTPRVMDGTATPRRLYSSSGSAFSGVESVGSRQLMSRGGLSSGGASDSASVWKARLEEESRRRFAAEEKLERLQSMMETLKEKPARSLPLPSEPELDSVSLRSSRH
mmetsp:Transcript_137653/g.439791  ORF Transcript_137653/g.439791 Transcript_137653/m.439791 type:complete len:211 (+) Transcript_137653:57-689(+)